MTGLTALQVKSAKRVAMPMGGALSVGPPERLAIMGVENADPLSDMTMTKVLRDLDLERVTVQGFRSSFTD